MTRESLEGLVMTDGTKVEKRTTASKALESQESKWKVNLKGLG